MLFSEKWFRNHPQFLLNFLIHIDVLMLCRKFELIPIKIEFKKIFKVTPKSGQRPCTIVQGHWPNFIKNV